MAEIELYLVVPCSVVVDVIVFALVVPLLGVEGQLDVKVLAVNLELRVSTASVDFVSASVAVS